MTISATTQGIKPGVCLSTARPVNPFDGQVIYMTDVDQTAVWDGSQWTVLAPIAGGRNGIINGAMNVWQRGTSSASQGYVTADRWFMLGTSTTFSQETSDLPANFRNALKYTMSGTAQPFSMQAIETQNSIRFAGKTVVLSYYVKTSNSTNAMVRIDSSNNVDESIQGTYSVIASNSVATTTSWRRVSSTFTIPSTSRTLRILVGSDVNLTSGQTILVTGIQLEEGAVATPFEFEDYGTTLQKCLRYYEQGESPIHFQIIINGSFVPWTERLVYYKVRKRSTGAVSVTVTGTNNAAANNGTVQSFNVDGFSHRQDVNNGGFPYCAYSMVYTVNSEL
jgi:hypothetical protein